MLQKEQSASLSSVFRGARFFIAGTLLVMAGFISSANAGIYLSPLGVYETGETDEDAAEIVAHDPLTQRLFVVNGFTKGIDVLYISNPDNPVKIDEIDLSAYGAGANSIDVYDGVLAVAVESDPKQDPGTVVFFETSSDFNVELNQLEVGALPDMLTFTPDGQYLLVANEGEPNDAYTDDPEGSVSIIKIGNNVVADVTQADVRTARFTNRTRVSNRSSVRVFGPNATPAQDFEPEYIAVYQQRPGFGNNPRKVRWKAMVTLQENNAVAIVDVERARIEKVVGLGFKDHSKAENAIDASNQDDGININTWPVYGMYQPDAIAAYAHRGRPYFLIANEGDAREYEGVPGFEEEVRVGEIMLDPSAFPDASALQMLENLGRLKITNTLGDIDNDGDYDRLFSFGARSFSILNHFGRHVFDSAGEFEYLTASLVPEIFNSDELDFDNRSDDKGSEPEGVTVGEINDRVYAFIGLERTGGIMIYDVTDPRSPFFVSYTNTGEEKMDGTIIDVAPEGIEFIPAANSPNDKPLLAVGFEFSGSTRIFEIKP